MINPIKLLNGRIVFLLISGNLQISAQCASGTATSSVSDVTLQCAGGTANRSGVAFNPNQNLYYSVNAGSGTYPVETFALGGGSSLNSNAQSQSFRGYWWNPATGMPEGNIISGGGIYAHTLTALFYASSTASLMAPSTMPDPQSCGAGDMANNQVLYYYNGSIYKYSRINGALITSISITGLPVALTNLNSNSLIYTGVSGKEVGVYDYVNTAVYFINYTTGAYVSTCDLPSTAPPRSSFGMGFANNRIFLFDGTPVTWIGYPIVTAASISAQTNVNCFGGSNGAATIAGSGGAPYTYTWYPSGGNAATASNLAAGAYTCAITNSCGITEQKIVQITQPAVLATTTLVSNALCNGGMGSGTITATGGTGAYTYSWSTNATTSVTSLPPGLHTATVIDANSCTSVKSVTITQPPALVTSTAAINAICNGGAGSGTITATGGTGAYTYLWSTGATASVASLPAGIHTSTISDANGCTKTESFSITQPLAMTPTIVIQSSVTCNGGTDGSAIILNSGGSGPLSYLWLPAGGTSSTVAGMAAGIYSCTITDANLCTVTKTIAINQPSALTATLGSTPILCHGKPSTITINAGGGTPSYLGTGSFTALAGPHTYTVVDVNGCSTTVSVNITEPPAITGAQSFTICAGKTLTVGTSTYSASGNYTDVFTAANGCDSTVTTNLIVNSPINVSTSLTAGVLTVNQSGGSYQWLDCNKNKQPIPGATQMSYTTTPAGGSYAVIVTVGSCSNTSACFSVITTGIMENKGLKQMTMIYPNPSKGQFTIELSNEAQVIITDAIGRLVISSKLEPGKTTIDLQQEKSGLYFVKLISKDGQSTRRLMIDK